MMNNTPISFYSFDKRTEVMWDVNIPRSWGGNMGALWSIFADLLLFFVNLELFKNKSCFSFKTYISTSG